jgi:REP element-mobilizing transposase RayT
MARRARKHSIDPNAIQVVHVWNRCIRGMMLCGTDPLTKKCREYRREWSRDKLAHLAGIFAIEVLTYAIMSNHTHQVLRSRPDIARTWSPESVARRWLMLTPKVDRAGHIIEPAAEQIQSITDNPELVEKLRLRLSDISFWMKSYAHYIAVRANGEDKVEGHFWQGRFKAHVLVDEASILRCMLYVDLNPIRAGMADSIEESDYTGAKDRLDDLRIHVATNQDDCIRLSLTAGTDTVHWERLDHQHSGWLSPIQIDSQLSEAARHHDGNDLLDSELNGAVLAAAEQQSSEQSDTIDGGTIHNPSVSCPRRVSGRGAIRISLAKYLLLLDLVGRQQREGGSGFIPETVVPVLEQMNIEPLGFAESICMFGRQFKTKVHRQPTKNAASRTNHSPLFAVLTS